MKWIGWICIGFGLIRWIVSLVNLVCRPYLPLYKGEEIKGKISVLIPVRNEETHIGGLLNKLLCLSLPPFEILVYDDESTDDTVRVVEQYMAENPTVRLIRGGTLPKGWLGKNHACHQLALEAKGDFFLFLDADVKVEDGFGERLIAYMRKERLQLLSIFPKQLMPAFSTRLAVPLINWILLSLLPLPLVKHTSFPSLSAANGQCICFDAGFYRKLSPHRQVKSDPVEDIAIMKLAKQGKGRVAVLLGNRDISCRMYNDLREAVEGFSKNIFRFFGNSKMLTLMFAGITTLAPFSLFLWNGVFAGIIYLLLIIFMRIFISVVSRQSVFQNLLLMIPQQLVFLYIIYTAFRKERKKEIVWKERNVYGVS